MKGQAALEFLTTYGWMFLVIIAVFGAFSYFGFTNVKDAIPASCIFLDSFRCDATHATEDGRFGFQFANLVGESINITTVVCEFPDESQQLKYEYDPAVVLARNDQMTVHCDGTQIGGLDYRGNTRFQTLIVYVPTNDDGALPKVVSGDLVIAVSDDTTLMDSYETAEGTWSNRLIVS